jgi:hypothetical protein
MKKLFLSLLILALMAGSAQAITTHSRVQYTGYSTAAIIIESANADSGLFKVVLFLDKVDGTTREDSLTSCTTPDTITITGLDEGVTYYYSLLSIDTTTGGTYTEPSDGTAFTFTTTDLRQNVSVIYTGYSTAGIMVDSAGLSIGVDMDSVRLDIDKTDGTTYSASITTVTVPQDTFAVTGLDEGVTYYYRTIAFMTDSSAADTLTAGSFTTTDLGSVISVLRSNIDSLILIIDSTTMCPESLIVQWGAGLAAITAVADTTATPNCPDTIIITGLIEGGTYYYRALGLLVDSSVVDTGSIGTYTRPHNSFVENARFEWSSNSRVFLHWDFDLHTDTYTTGAIPITSAWLRIHVSIDGEDDFATSDSINVFLNTYEFGDMSAIDTLVAIDPDTVTITPLKYRMQPGILTDSTMKYYPEWDWGTHYSVTASMSNDDGQGDSTTTLGIRSVHVIIEEIQ